MWKKIKTFIFVVVAFIRKYQLKIFGFIGVAYIVVVTILFARAYYHTLDISSLIDTKVFADYGTHLGGIGAILAFFFAFASFWSIEESSKKKDFETTFFNMLHHFDSLIDQIKISEENRIKNSQTEESLSKEYTGISALNVLLKDFLESVIKGTTLEEFFDNDSELVEDLIQVRWSEVYDLNLESLPHYFRYYYTLVKFIMKSDKGIEKKYYTDLLQAMMSSSEMSLIFYNTFYNDKISTQRGAQEFQKWLDDPTISLLENIDAKSVLSTEHLKTKCPNILFKFDLTKK